MKKILLIGTGGTIASDVTEDGLAPELTTEQLLSHLPAISGHLRCGLCAAAESGQHQYAAGALVEDGALHPGKLWAL